jgi:hypothetical protein
VLIDQVIISLEVAQPLTRPTIETGDSPHAFFGISAEY